MPVYHFYLRLIKYPFIFFLLFFANNICAQVDLPSGKAQVDFPLFNYGNDDRLSTSISLVYTDGGGVKVNKMASNVGLGWELSCGGVISRITKGEPDDQMGGTYGGDLFATGNLYTPYYGSRQTMPYGMG